MTELMEGGELFEYIVDEATELTEKVRKFFYNKLFLFF